MSGLSDVKDLVVIVGVGYAIYWIIQNKDKFNPMSDKNIAYASANETVQWLTNGKYLTVGDWLYSLSGRNDLDPIQFSPFIKPDGTRGSRVTMVSRMRDGQRFAVDYSGATPKLIAV